MSSIYYKKDPSAISNTEILNCHLNLNDIDVLARLFSIGTFGVSQPYSDTSSDPPGGEFLPRQDEEEDRSRYRC